MWNELLEEAGFRQVIELQKHGGEPVTLGWLDPWMDEVIERLQAITRYTNRGLESRRFVVVPSLRHLPAGTVLRVGDSTEVTLPARAPTVTP